MSKPQFTNTDSDGLTEADRERFERLAEYFEDKDPEFAEFCAGLAQSIEVSKS